MESQVFLMPAMAWLMAILLFGVGVLVVRALKPSLIWRDVTYPVSKISSTKGCDDPASLVEITYLENGEQRTAKLTVDQFKKLVTQDKAYGRAFLPRQGAGCRDRNNRLHRRRGRFHCSILVVLQVVLESGLALSPARECNGPHLLF